MQVGFLNVLDVALGMPVVASLVPPKGAASHYATSNLTEGSQHNMRIWRTTLASIHINPYVTLDHCIGPSTLLQACLRILTVS